MDKLYLPLVCALVCLLLMSVLTRAVRHILAFIVILQGLSVISMVCLYMYSLLESCANLASAELSSTGCDSLMASNL